MAVLKTTKFCMAPVNRPALASVPQWDRPTYSPVRPSGSGSGKTALAFGTPSQ